MADARSFPRANGFSIVEMMVALVFTLVLMAGMASVFKASLSTFYTSGETLANARRNQMSVELLGDDLNTACMYVEDPDNGPGSALTAANPPFYVLPNVAITGSPSPAGPSDPISADELYFVLEQAFPFQGTLQGVGGNSAAEAVVAGVAPPPADNTFNIDCHNSAYAKSLRKGNRLLFMDSTQAWSITNDPQPPNGNVVTVVVGSDTNSFITGSGPTQGPSAIKHADQIGVMFYLPLQMVRYRLEYLQLDPTNANGIPCLVRDQGTYSGTGFAPDLTLRQIITENVQGFKVYLSVNSGQSWAGLGLAPANPIPPAGSGFSEGWDQGIRTLLDTQLANGVGTVAASGRPGFTSTRPNSTMGQDWFRYIPTLVRVDVTTRSAAQRTEYATTANTAAYKQLTQSLVFMPRHSGLPLGN